MRVRNEYYYLPKKFHKRHDYCEFVINQIEDLIQNNTFEGLKTQVIEFPKGFTGDLSSEKHILDLLEEHNFKDELNHIVRNRILLSLIMETCYFIQEGLLCSLKMRMTVCFTLFRKPFLEILIVLMRILSEKDFIEKFNNLEGFDPIKTSPKQKLELIKKSNQNLQNKYIENDIFDFIFNKDFGDSLFNITNNAIHLFTNRNPASATEKQNLNFIFSNQENIESQWEYIYDTIPMLLTFIADLTDLLVFKSTSVDEKVFTVRFKKREDLRRRNKVD